MQDFYNELQNLHQSYYDKWGVSPNVLYIDHEKFFELLNWSATNDRNLQAYLFSQLIHNTQITILKGFSQGLMWLELDDVLSAIRSDNNYVDKCVFTSVDIDPDPIDGVPKAIFERLIIPFEILGVHSSINN